MWSLLVVVAIVLLATPTHARKNLWDQERFLDMLKKAEWEESRGRAKEQKKFEHQWSSEGGSPWVSQTSERSFYSELNILWSSAIPLSGSLNEGDMSGAVTGDIHLYKVYVSTYLTSHKLTWASSGKKTSPDGSVSTWTSHYTSYWTSSYTSSYETSQITSTWQSEWTSCDTGVRTWTSLYQTVILVNPGSEVTGAVKHSSEGQHSTRGSWFSTYKNGFTSKITGESKVTATTGDWIIGKRPNKN